MYIHFRAPRKRRLLSHAREGLKGHKPSPIGHTKNRAMRPNLLAAIALFSLSLGVEPAGTIRAPEYTRIDKLRQIVVGLDERARLSLEELIGLYRGLGDEIDRQFAPEGLESYLDALSNLWLWARTQSEMRGVDGLYGTFRNMQRDGGGAAEEGRPGPIGLREWINFARTVLSDANASIPAALERIAGFIVDQKLFVSAYQEASMQICNTQQSAQQLLFNLYNTIALTEIKGYTMMQFSFTLLKLYDKGNFTREMEQLKQEYAIRTSETLRAIKAAMEVAPREIWTCDPPKHKPGVTYTELSEVFQGYIVNEVDMNNQGTCMENCNYYTYSKVYGCYKNQFCAQQRRCNGKLVNCQYVDSDMWICPSDKNSSRRYEYIEYENGLVYGKKDKCHRGTTKVDSWWRWLFWHCSYCMCFCDEQNLSSERHFNLRNVTSNIDDNKVVTALRIKKQNQIIHIQIQEGKLLPRGGIDGKSIAWKKVDNYTIFDADVKAETDYHTITWQNRAVDLDDLHAEPEHLLTGIKFRLIGKHLNLEIRVTPFNFTTGMLIKEKSFWHSEDTTEIGEMYGTNGEILKSNKRTEFKLKNPDIPTRSIAQSVPDSQSNQYLMFSPSDLRKDAAQSTVPFIDLQAVEPKPPVPISGAGIYHKGRDGYGGFLALKLYTYNFETQLRAELPYSTPVVGLSNDIQS